MNGTASIAITLSIALLWSAHTSAQDAAASAAVPEPPAVIEKAEETPAFDPAYELETLGLHSAQPNDNNELLTLGEDAERFTIRHVPARKKSSNVVVVIPPYARLVTELPVFSVLAEEFTSNNWSVVAIQLPLLEPAKSLDDYRDLDQQAQNRIALTMSWLRKQHYQAFLVFGQRRGAKLANDFLLGAGDTQGILGLATLGRWVHRGELANRPSLQLIGSLDALGINAAQQRHYQWLASDSASRLIQVEGTKHRFEPHASQVSRYLRGWTHYLVANK